MSIRSLTHVLAPAAAALAAVCALLGASHMLASDGPQTNQVTNQVAPAPFSAASRAVPMATTSTPKHLYSKSGYDITPWPRAKVVEAAKSLPPDVQHILLEAGTEPAFCGLFTDNKEDGIYVCAIGGLPNFKSEHKFTSSSGWASFHTPFDPAHVIEREDSSHGMRRVEILDARTGAHLGHVFDDGPKPTGRRYCLNSGALRFISKGAALPAESQPVKAEAAYFGGGCFWGVEDAFAAIDGVMDAESGFAGGSSDKATYQEVCRGTTGHAEIVKITFDPAVVPYRDLVKQFFRIHDPTTMNRQGPDVGDQYRSAIFTASDAQRATALEIIDKLGQLDAFKTKKVVTQVAPIQNYIKAEEYHQDYHRKNGGQCHMRGFQGELPF
ncbi:MAG: bifunctional methionine sulfoxide reductase B/A protein [Phycisphaerae bacterium]|nr:bifunctional methionine sulfoxide reductase B/A protein [Phycisphaerae bacterium]